MQGISSLQSGFCANAGTAANRANPTIIRFRIV
jgi:hypothetical protein